MTYAECRDAALHLIHQRSIAGQIIPGSYNNQQDYLDKIPSLINAAQMDLATTTKKIPAAALLGELAYTSNGRSRIYSLPEDLWQKNGAGILIPVPNGRAVRYKRYNQYRQFGRDRIIVPADVPEDSILEYWRYPRRLSQLPADTDELDNVPEAQEAVPYYVGAHLVILDDAFLYASLYNAYEEKKQNMMELATAEPDIVEDVYSAVSDYYPGW